MLKPGTKPAIVALDGVSGVSPHLTMYLAKNPFVQNFYLMVNGEHLSRSIGSLHQTFYPCHEMIVGACHGAGKSARRRHFSQSHAVLAVAPMMCAMLTAVLALKSPPGKLMPLYHQGGQDTASLFEEIGDQSSLFLSGRYPDTYESQWTGGRVSK